MKRPESTRSIICTLRVIVGDLRPVQINHAILEIDIRSFQNTGFIDPAATIYQLKDSPELRSVQLPAPGKVVEFPEVGGLHHHFEWLAA